jgi:hypothetical protein
VTEAEMTIDADYLREIAQYDWLYAGRFDRLHAPAEADYDAEEWAAVDVTFACGWQVPMAWIPGIFSRADMTRCAHCCDKVGLPRGDGSPKNDPECRRILRLDEPA